MGVGDEALGVTPGRTTSSADLGGSKFFIHPLLATFTDHVI